MTFKEQVQQAADAGHQMKPQYDQWREEQRLLEQKRNIEADQALTARARENLKHLPANVQAAARKGEKTAFAALVLHQEIERLHELPDGQPFDPNRLKGEARRKFELLQEAQLSPFVFVTDFGWHYIMVHVPALSS